MYTSRIKNDADERFDAPTWIDDNRLLPELEEDVYEEVERLLYKAYWARVEDADRVYADIDVPFQKGKEC